MLYGCCFYNGVNATQNYTKAAIWFRRAAAQEDAGAQNNLGQCYEKGRGIVKDKNEAAKWLIYSYHLLRELTLGVVYSEREAVQWYRRAANQGHAEAQYNLGRCYQEGIGVAEDAREAVKWFRLSADQGYSAGQADLGRCYILGKGVAKDEREAVQWYRRAANQGHAEAQYNLGWCYQSGRGVAKDEREARKWFGMAKDQGYDPIGDWLTWVDGIFSPN